MINDIINLFISFIISLFRIYLLIILFNLIHKIVFKEELNTIKLANLFKKKKKNKKITFKDVIGLENVKDDLKEYVNFIKNRKEYIKAGYKIPKGLLFSGPPGTGKTLLAKALAEETNSNFISASGSDFIEVYVGVGAKRIRDLFSKARRNKPSIIFIDEIDSIGRRRDGFNTSGHNEQGTTLNSLLVEMDGFNQSDEILVIAASNMIGVLDRALLRSGRFDKKIYFDKPNIKERESMFNLYLKNIKIHPTFNKEKYKNINLLAQLTANSTGADIANICNQAVGIYMKRFDKNKPNDGTTLEDLTKAIDDIIIGIEKRERMMTPKERNIVSHHEAGHALVAYILVESVQPVKVSIIPRGEAALGFSMQKPIDKKLYTKNELIAKICVLLGGRISEEINFNEITTGSSDDIYKISLICKNLINDYGMNSKLEPLKYDENNKIISEKKKIEIDFEMSLLTSKCVEITKKILKNNINNIKLLADFLLKNEVIVTSDFNNIFKDQSIENSVSINELFN